jgi:uncharacterized protein
MGGQWHAQTTYNTAMTRLVFTWYEAKNQSNRKNHQISFETAARAFDDPFHLSEQDRIEDGEERWQTLGRVGDVTLLLVAYTVAQEEPGEDLGDEPVELIRIISARTRG